MIDTIKAYQNLWALGMTEEQAEQHVRSLTAKIAWGYPKKALHEYSVFRVWVSYNKLMIQGSLCKLYFGNNLQTMNRHQTAEAIQQLEQLLGFSLDGFILSRIDFSENINTNGPVSRYIDAFEGVDRFNTDKHSVNENATGKYFHQSQRMLLLYDKVREIHKKRRRKSDQFPLNNTEPKYDQQVDELIKFFGRNYLRIEYRYIRNIGRQMGREQLQLKELSEKSAYHFLVREWFKVICRIQYREQILPDLEHLDNAADLKRAFLIAGIAFFGGIDEVLKTVRRLPTSPGALKYRKAAMVKLVKSIANNDLLDSFGKELFLEVRKKAVQLALMHLEKRPWVGLTA